MVIGYDLLTYNGNWIWFINV